MVGSYSPPKDALAPIVPVSPVRHVAVKVVVSEESVSTVSSAELKYDDRFFDPNQRAVFLPWMNAI
jgi:hypothetical protein